MRLATVRPPGWLATRAARIEQRVTGDVAVLLESVDLAELLRSNDWRQLAAENGVEVPVDDVQFRLPLGRPGKVVCVGLNYRDHIREMGRELPRAPTLFAKFPDALVGPYDPIELPAGGLVDWEAELAVVVGRRCRSVTAQDAVEAIAGYTVLNDVTARDYQRRTSQWLQGKSWTGTTPVGPVMVTADEVDPEGSGHPDLEIHCEVDGVRKQQSRTGELVFGPADLLAYISVVMQLEPGDLIATGTPGGVGSGRQPPEGLATGSVVRTYIEGIGACLNPCRDVSGR